MRLLADENISNVVIERLRRAGFDVLSIAETQSGASDRQVFDVAAAEGRFVITEDRDFGEMVIRQRVHVRGLMLLELDRLSNVKEAELVAEALATHTDKLMGNLIVVEPTRIRIRPLPHAGKQPPNA
jgi:predicted nuclease of predicted toxin-antitoxin system